MTKETQKFEEPLDSIIRDLCDAVNANYDEIDFNEDDWYNKHSWTMAEEYAFENKLIGKVSTNKELYGSLFNTFSKKSIEKGVKMFLLTYGWKYLTEQN